MTLPDNPWVPILCEECSRGPVAQRLHFEEDRVLQAIAVVAVRLVAEGKVQSPGNPLLRTYVTEFKALLKEFDDLPDIVVPYTTALLSLEADLSES